jgi:uncharacterized membrane protein
MATTNDRLVDDYLGRLKKELRDLPRSRRRELLDEIREHIEEERSQLDIESEAALRNILDRLGEPADIAAEARYRFGVRPSNDGVGLEVAALILLLIGGIVVPFIGWLAGVVLLWLSDVWSKRDKLIGTLVVPGGLLGSVVALAVLAQHSIQPCPGNQPCSGADVGSILLVVLAIVITVASIATIGYLGLRLRARRRADLALDLG